MVSVPARRQQVAYGRELGLSARRACIAVLGSAINVEVSQPQGDEGCTRGRADDRVVGAVSPLRVSAHPYFSRPRRPCKPEHFRSHVFTEGCYAVREAYDTADESLPEVVVETCNEEVSIVL